MNLIPSLYRYAPVQTLFALLLIMLLASCGGGSSTSVTTDSNTTPPAPLPLPPTTNAVLTYLNTLRVAAGMATYLPSTFLNDSATAHTNYLLTNNIMAHIEVFGAPGFTGLNADARALVAGYRSYGVAENISTNKGSGSELIDSLMTAVYHRMSLLDFDKDELGVGLVINQPTTDGSMWSALTTNSGFKAFNDICAQGGEVIQAGTYYHCNDNVSRVSANSNDVWLVTLRAKSLDVVVWPPAGGAVSPAFYEETPDPLPACSVSGNPVSAQVNPAFNSQIALNKTSFTLTDMSTGLAVPLVQTLDNSVVQPDPLAASWTTPSKQWLSAFPTKRLNWGTTYRASIDYTLNGTATTKTWTFSTHTLPKAPVVVTLPNTDITATGQTQFVFYIPPGDCKASTMQVNITAIGHVAPQINIDGIDPHTYIVTMTGASEAAITFTQTGVLPGSLTHTRVVNLSL